MKKESILNGFNVELSENVLKFVLVDKCLDFKRTVFIQLSNKDLFNMTDIIKAVVSKADMLNEYIEDVYFIDDAQNKRITDNVTMFL